MGDALSSTAHATFILLLASFYLQNTNYTAVRRRMKSGIVRMLIVSDVSCLYAAKSVVEKKKIASFFSHE